MKVLLCGFGNMGQTFTHSFVKSGFIKAEEMYIVLKDKSLPSERYHIPEDNFFTWDQFPSLTFDIIVLAVKPQDFGQLVEQLHPKIIHNATETIFLSVMAGIEIQTIEKMFSTHKVVRSMPNLPTTIGQGMTVFSASQKIDRKDLFIIQNLINTTGTALYVEDENLINAATAISGSGPAYVFYFMQAMIQSAVKLGFTHSEAELLVNQTFTGASMLQKRKDLTPQEWIDRVASRGGTTESALQVFADNTTDEIISKAIQQAFERAVTLGKGK